MRWGYIFRAARAIREGVTKERPWRGARHLGGLVEGWGWEGEDGLCEKIEMGGCERGYTTGDGAMHAEEGDDVVEVGFDFGTDCGGLTLVF